MAPGPRYLRIRGQLDGDEVVVELPPGVLRVGSVDDNDIVLPAHGVSRHHALLRVADTRSSSTSGLDARAKVVKVEDLGSKNGTRINGRATTKGAAAVGDQLFFGPTRWRLEAIDAADVRLAISLDASRVLLEIRDLAAERARPGNAGSDLEMIESMLDRLAAGVELQAALDAVAPRLGMQGACWLDWPQKAEHRTLASWGLDFRALIDPGELFRHAEAQAGSRKVVVFRAAGPPALTAAVLLDRARPQALLGWDAGELSSHLLRIAVRLLARHTDLARAPEEAGELELPADYVGGDGPVLRALHRRVATLAANGSPVLIAGERGVGKKTLAQLLHATAQSQGPMVITGCAELTDAALAQGYRVAAEGHGSLLLVEIADLHPTLHEPVLQLLDASSGRPRLMLTTASDLTELADAGTVPTELYLRLGRGLLTVPPLRHRRDQIPLLAGRFFRQAIESHDSDSRGLTVDALRHLMRYHWPGNVAELKTEIERLVEACTDARAIESLSLPEAILQPSASLETS